MISIATELWGVHRALWYECACYVSVSWGSKLQLSTENLPV